MPLQEEVAAASAAPAAEETLMKLNPCDRENSRLGAAFAALTYGTDCRCCIGARIVAALVFGLVVGAAVAHVL
ncbi:hypothetical protein WJ69_22995 [Burkholderia ubonensis]|uniref:hypothetical protein n=1 Tax=Burkholderia ubonensis TaxID=101571 RepID=UPI00075955B7|nr:hypothetical protein [Burkholderia ubonensis]KVO05571.1 hypothetical protein WJ69_22995 [Burkholderia ubonensis]